MAIDIYKLAQDLKDASQAAREAVKGVQDGGTCNFDSAVLRFPRVRNTTIQKAALIAGVSCFRFSNGGYHVETPVSAQGQVRTIQAEKMYEVLKERGWAVGMYYQMD